MSVEGPESVETIEALQARVDELERQVREGQEAAAFLRSVLEAVPAFVMRLSSDLKIEFINRMLPGFQIEQVLGSSVYQWVDLSAHEDARRAFENARQTGQIQLYHSQGEGAGGQVRRYVTHVAPIRMGGSIGFTLAAFDVTEQHRTEEQLRHAQKLEAVGQLTAGVAHNFNNMLSVMLPTLQLVERLVPPDRRVMVRSALEAGHRATDLVKQMVRFAGNQGGDDRKMAAIEDLVHHAVSICRRVFDREIDIVERYEAWGACVHVSTSDIEQTLINLLINARDALAGVLSPRIDVSVSCPDRNKEVLIRVSDNGVGMDEHVLARIFEPFFTTKAPDRGTGLGLATAYASLRDHGGSISCSSTPGQGTTFILSLPVRWSPPASKPPSSAPPADLASGQRALVIDDEEGVRRVLGWILREAGYHLAFAASVSEALDVLDDTPDISFAIVDRSMPGGLTVASLRQMRERAPGIRLLLHTGEDPSDELIAAVEDVLLKPASSDEILARIAKMLAHKG